MRLECQEIEDFFSDYLDNSLQTDLMAQVREHLHSCPSCLDLLNEVKRTLAICEEMPPLEPPARLIEQILVKTSGKVQRLSWMDYLRDLFRPFYASPRFATGVGLAAVSLGLVLNSLGIDFSRISQLRLADLTPKALYRNVEHSVNLAYDNGVRRLNDLKLLYEIQQRIDELRSQPGKKSGDKDKPTVQPPQRPDSSASAIEYLVALNVPLSCGESERPAVGSRRDLSRAEIGDRTKTKGIGSYLPSRSEGDPDNSGLNSICRTGMFT